MSLMASDVVAGRPYEALTAYNLFWNWRAPRLVVKELRLGDGRDEWGRTCDWWCREVPNLLGQVDEDLNDSVGRVYGRLLFG